MLVRWFVFGALALLGPTAAQARELTVNGRPATAADLAVLASYEARWGAPVPSGAYWYDGVSGAVGRWGGPTAGWIAPGLGLGGGTAPAEASGGGAGRLTGVFVNGRELHPLDVQGLATTLGTPVLPGRWWVDAAGNFGAVGGPALGNLVAIARAQSASRGTIYTTDRNNHSSAFVTDGCAAVSGRLRASDETSSYDYYVGCE